MMQRVKHVKAGTIAQLRQELHCVCNPLREVYKVNNSFTMNNHFSNNPPVHKKLPYIICTTPTEKFPKTVCPT